MASLINKAKEKIEATLDKKSNQANNPHSSNAGPHSSNLVNKADPYVDSDRDHRNDPTSRVGGIGSTQEYSSIHGQTTSGSSIDPGYSHNVGHTTGHTAGLGSGHTTGHHVDHSSGLTGGHTGYNTGHTGTTGHGVGHNVPLVGHTGHTDHTGGHSGATNTYDNPQSTNTGPHRSNLANKLDPRTDSDNDNRNDPTSRVGGYGTQTDTYGHNTGAHGGHTGPGGIASHSHGHNTGVHGGPTGPGGIASHSHGHNTGATTGLGGNQGYSSATPGSGNAANTAGPHNSDLLNKLDPRVDADLDGSKTYGGNATYR